MQPELLRNLIAADMLAVDAMIRRRLESDVVLVRQIAEYIIAGGGKRLRPALVFLAAGATGYRGEHHVELAAVVEFIHTATLLQLLNAHNFAGSEAAYPEVIRRKTAKLFEAAAQLGAILGEASAELEQGLARYGMHLGTAFQLIDDVLDYSGDAAHTGKNLGDDLKEGKP